MSDAQKSGFLLEKKIDAELKKLNIFDRVLSEKEIVRQFGQTFYGIDHLIIINNMLITIQDKWETTSPDKQQISDFINVTEKMKDKMNFELLCALFVSKLKMTTNGNEKIESANKL